MAELATWLASRIGTIDVTALRGYWFIGWRSHALADLGGSCSECGRSLHFEEQCKSYADDLLRPYLRNATLGSFSVGEWWHILDLLWAIRALLHKGHCVLLSLMTDAWRGSG